MNLKKLFLVSVISILVLAGCTQQVSQQKNESSDNNLSFTNISAQNLSDKLENKDFYLLDVHIPEQEHIEKTDAFIPYTDLRKRADELPKDKSTPIVVYCRSGGMSLEASQTLVDLGYSEVMNLQGGRNAFVEMNN